MLECFFLKKAVIVNYVWYEKNLKELTSGLKDVWITLAVASGKGFHHTVDFLRLTRKAETPQELPVKHRMNLF